MYTRAIRQAEVLFADDRHIHSSDLRWMAPTGEELPLVAPPEPMVPARAEEGYTPYGLRWETRPPTIQPLPEGSAMPNVILRDGGRYRGWTLRQEYEGADLGCYTRETPKRVWIRRHESEDGLHWSVVGETETDIPKHHYGFDGGSVFIDPNAPADERYKFFYCHKTADKEERLRVTRRYIDSFPEILRDERLWIDSLSGEGKLVYIHALVSGDGESWRFVPEPIMAHFGDTDNTIYYDENLQKYVFYTRLMHRNRRQNGRAESKDFYSGWEPPRPLTYPELSWPMSDDIYTNARSTYPYQPEYHFMFPMVYHRIDQTSDIRCMISEDGILWRWVPGEPVLRPGRVGEKRMEFIYAVKNLQALEGDRVGLYFNAVPYPHKYPRWTEVLESGWRGVATWPRGRMVAMCADRDAYFVTDAMVPQKGKRLRLNASILTAGEIRIGVIAMRRMAGEDLSIQTCYAHGLVGDVEGRQPEDCDPVTGDGLTLPVTWKGEESLGIDEGDAVRLVFRMRHAELYGLRWE